MVKNKVVYVKAYFKPVGKEVTIDVPTGEKKKGLFGGENDVTKKETRWQQTGWSDSMVDGERLSRDIESAIKNLNAEGYEVVSILSIISGNYYYQSDRGIMSGAEFGSGYGYSYTEGVTIIAKSN